jgi:hypothetical protein
MAGKGDDVAIAAQLTARIAEAKARLHARMRDSGLSPENGWRVLEELRNTPTGQEFVLRPVHLQHETDIEVAVAIDRDGRPG